MRVCLERPSKVQGPFSEPSGSAESGCEDLHAAPHCICSPAQPNPGSPWATSTTDQEFIQPFKPFTHSLPALQGEVWGGEEELLVHLESLFNGHAIPCNKARGHEAAERL